MMETPGHARTVKESWENFHSLVLDGKAPHVIAQANACFYAGAWGMYRLLHDLAGDDDEPKEAYLAKLEAIDAEFEAHKAMLKELAEKTKPAP